MPTYPMTVTEFCRAHRISRPTFYEWAKRGDAPRVIALGNKRLITQEEAEKWRRLTTRHVYAGTGGA